MKLNKLLIILPIALLSLSACNGSSSGSNGGNGSSLPLGACDEHGVFSGSAPGLTAGTESENFDYFHGYDDDKKIVLSMYYQASRDKHMIVELMSMSVNLSDTSDLTAPAGYCSILGIPDDHNTPPADLMNSFIGLSNCAYSMDGDDTLKFTSTYKVFTIADSGNPLQNLQDNNSVRQGPYNFSCKLIHRDGNIPD